jgi:NADPH2 dehydrogenase
MCQYSVEANDGKPNDWHYLHYVSRAVGGTGLIIMEMTDIEPDGRTTDRDLGIWSDDHIDSFTRIINAVHKHQAKIGIQIAHAGRKSQCASIPVAPSPIAMEGYKTPRELKTEEVLEMVQKYKEAAERAVAAGVDLIEIHGAHGYLIHQFVSPLTNKRNDAYGMDLPKFGVEVIEAVKKVIPDSMPLCIRISGVEYVPDGYDLDYMIEVCRRFREAGVDIFHVSSGGEGPIPSFARPNVHEGYQVPLARAIKKALEVPVIAVGLLHHPVLAKSVIANGDADLIAVGRGILKDPYWAHHAALELGIKPDVSEPYVRAFI